MVFPPKSHGKSPRCCFLSDRVVRVIHQRQRQGGTRMEETLRGVGIDLQDLEIWEEKNTTNTFLAMDQYKTI